MFQQHLQQQLQMKNNLKNDLIYILWLLLGFFPNTAFGVEPSATLSVATPCAVVKDFQGEVEMLDYDRSLMPIVQKKSAVPCGAWISVKHGAAILEHRQGVEIKLAQNSFVQFFDNDQNKHLSGEDHLIVFKGKAYFHVPNGVGEFRIITANARARMQQGTAVILYNQADDETQFISLERPAVLENRFAAEGKIKVKAGEATTLSLRLKRVVPTTASAVKFAPMKALLEDLPLTDDEERLALMACRERQDRTFASLLVSSDKTDRQIASEQNKKRMLASTSYVTHPIGAEQKKSDLKGYKSWVRKLVGGELTGERILFPQEVQTQTKKSERVKDPGLPFEIKEQGEINKERERLIQELKKIQR